MTTLLTSTTSLGAVGKSARKGPSRALALGLALALACGASFAEKPEWAGKGNGKNKGESHGQVERGEAYRGGQGNKGDRVEEVRIGGFFGEPQRAAANTYYGQQFSSGHCPPGLAKKNNGCLPPGQAKKYSIGQPLPRGVVYYPVPQPVLVQLGAPPAGHKYVRVATDILLIAIGTGMVVDAIQDLGRV
ncbi:MAG: RcnB family protein [Polaromonas sp.]|uniref:RcnB family protein n=1 Tax=Polaromonas sp. TaxID=1869339 RepID=UPI0025D82790|nr:RcnB family protein [Polaromonas sp.]MBI2727128.1 RcnB family protein [Polaromonas sp.]